MRSGRGDHVLSSLVRRVRRTALKPHACSGAPENRSVLNGMMTSAFHPCSSTRRHHLPHAVPVDIGQLTVAEDLRIVAGAGGVDEELEARDAVVQAVDDEAEHVGVVTLEVLVEGVDPNPGGVRIEAPGRDIQVGVVIEDHHLRLIHGGLAGLRLDLNEIGGNLSSLPGRLVQPSVERDGGRGPTRRQIPVEARRVVVDGTQRRRRCLAVSVRGGEEADECGQKKNAIQHR